MQNLIHSTRWTQFVLRTTVVAMIGILSSAVLSQEASSPIAPVAAQTETEPKPASNDKSPPQSDKNARTSRPDPRRSSTQEKVEPKTEKQLADERKAREAARKRGEITFDDLKFDIEIGAEFKPEMITKELKELDTKTFKLRGFILPTSVFQQSGIKQFVLVRDNQECCFGPGAAIYDCVIVNMIPGKTTNFATRVITVKGKLEIDTESYQYPDGGYYAIYRMTAEEVK